jgi:hypothetical protein
LFIWSRSIVTSKQFTFFISPNKEEFIVHWAPIPTLSETLSVLTTGSMAEARDGQATLPDADPDTIVRFCQFAYTGRYDEPVSDRVPSTNSVSVSYKAFL